MVNYIISKLNLKTIWFVFSVLVLLTLLVIVNVLFVTIALTPYINYSFNWSLIVSCLGLVVILYKALKDGYFQVSESWVWVVQFLGQHIGDKEDPGGFTAGPYIAFPYWGVMHVRKKWFMGEQMMELYMNEAEETGYGEGVVDFANGSAPVIAVVYFTVVNAYLATYGVADLYSSICEKIDGAIRAYLGSYNIDEANTLKVQFNLARILNGFVLKRDSENKIIEEDDNADATLKENDAYKKTKIWQEIKTNWGVEINSITVSDIVLSDDVIAIIKSKLIAEKEREVSLIKKETTITNAEAEQRQLELHGKGMASQFEELKEQGIEGEFAAKYLNDKRKWENVGDKTVIIDSGSGVSGLGAAIGAGMKAGSK